VNLNPIGPGRTPVPQPLTPARPAPEAGGAAPARLAEARSLEDLLTPEERDFFARLETLGPLTYRPNGPRAGATPAAPTGQRIDVRG